MDISQNYSGEMLLALLKQLDEKTGKVYDIVQLLLMSAEDNEGVQKALLADLQDVKRGTSEINAKLDVVLEQLNRIEKDFADLKTEQRDIEQKLTLMLLKLSKLEEAVSEEEIVDYRTLAQSLYANWDALDALTKRFIPLAEFLYSKLQKYDRPDYSPVILELCRAIENEFLMKIFSRYTLDLVRREGKGLNGFLASDRADSYLTNKTGQFVKAISKAARTNKPEYTLGQMNTILSLLNDEQTVNASPLLQDFKSYLSEHTEATSLLDSDYILQINEIVNKYRNPSAHPEFMSLQKANECREIMPERLDYLMDCVG